MFVHLSICLSCYMSIFLSDNLSCYFGYPYIYLATNWLSNYLSTYLWTKSCQEVVSIHEHVDEGIQKSAEGCVAT